MSHGKYDEYTIDYVIFLFFTFKNDLCHQVSLPVQSLTCDCLLFTGATSPLAMKMENNSPHFARTAILQKKVAEAKVCTKSLRLVPT
jgi:hypothetical protein